MAIAKLEITGAAAIDKRMAVLPVNVENRVMKKAATKAMRPVVTEAKRRARKQKRSGLLAKSLGQKVKQYKRAGITVVVAGPRKNYKDAQTGENPALIAHLVEGGTKKHVVSSDKGLANTKDVAFGFQSEEAFFGRSVVVSAQPKPFLGPAYESKKNEMESTFGNEVRNGVHAEAAKLGVIG